VEIVGKKEKFWLGSYVSSQLTQIFSNRSFSTGPIEARFTFPLPPNATVQSFEAKLGGKFLSKHHPENPDKFIKSEIKTLDKAIENYDDAIAKGNTAALVEKSDTHNNNFTINLGL
jgi:hypothetical protein